MNIRIATRRDVPAVVSLMRDFAEFEELLEYFEITEDRLANVLFGPNAFARCLVADDSNRLAAYAIFYPNFATFRGQCGYYLEDLYISSEYRRHGIGEKMLRAIAKLAVDIGFERIDFQVLDCNVSAIDFYTKHGAVKDEVERHFKFTDDAFRELAK